MDLLDAIEAGRFLGREFLVWLWFESEVLEGQFEMPDGERFELWLESQLTLESESAEQEITRMRGAAPSFTSEAHEALRRGKLPIQARIRIERGQQAFGCVLTAKTMTLSSATLPQLIKEDEEERFYERMYLIEELEKMVDSLYERFLSLRLSPVWETQVLPMIRRWVADPQQADAKKYRAAWDDVQPIGKGKKAGWVIEE
jgi:hypothetical protein